jgi:hypothetical protein
MLCRRELVVPRRQTLELVTKDLIMAGAAKSHAPDSTKYVEYEEYVDFQLEKTRAIVKRTDILTTLMALGVGVVSYLLAFVVFDQWIIDGGFGYASRIGLLSIVAVVVTGTLAWRVVWPLLRQVHPLYAARVIEQSDPKLKSNLVNFVDVKLANAESAPTVLKSMQKRAAVELSHIDVEEAVDHRPLLRIAYVLLGVVIVAALYIFLSPKDVFVSVRRALLPTSSIAVATKTTITDVDPGDKDVPARTRQMISAEVHGEEAEQAQILFTTVDHKYVDEPVKMRRESPGLSKFLGELNGENGKGLLQSLTYRIVAGDARSVDYSINVIQPPSARVDEVYYAFPKYTELPEKTASGGDIDGWEGTVVTIKAVANMKVARALIVLTDSDDKAEKGTEISMHVTDGTMLSGTWKLEFRSDGTAPRYYHIRVRTENQKKDDIDSDPTLYALRIRPDQRPDVALLDPTGDLTRPANAVIPLVVQAADPDFKIRSVMLRGTRGGDPLFNQDVKLYREDVDLPARSFSTQYHFQLEPLGLKPGDRIQFWIEAKDNKHPTANRTNTTPINVMIDKPVSPEEVQKQLAKDEQNQQDQLARANDARNSDRSNPDQPEPRAGDERDVLPQPRQDQPDPGVAEPKDKDESRNDQDDNPDQKDKKNSPDQQRKPAKNDEALSKLLRKQPSPDQDEQNQKDEQQGASDEKPADRSQQEQGAGDGQKGRGQSKNQKQSKSDQSQSDRGEGDQNSSTGDQQGQQTKSGDESSNSDGGDGSKNSNKKNSKGKSQPNSGRENSEPGTEQKDKSQAAQKSKKTADSEESSGGDEQKPAGKSGDKKDDRNKDGSTDSQGQDDPPTKTGMKKKPAGKNADQRDSDDANSDETEDGQKKGATKNQDQKDKGAPDSSQNDGTGDQALGDQGKKDKPGKKKPDTNDAGADGDEQKPGNPSDQKKPGAKEGGSGDDTQSTDGEKVPKQKNQQQGGAGTKAADKSDAGGGAKDDQQSSGTPDSSGKDPKGEQSDNDGQGGDKGPKNGKGPKKAGDNSNASGPEKPAEDDGTAQDKPATGSEEGEATGDDRPGDRKNPRAGDKVMKKEGSGEGAKKPGKPDDDSERQKAKQKGAADEGSEGAADDAEHADRAPDDKKAREKTGKLDEPPSEKGVERRDDGSEKRPGQHPDAGNQPMKGKGREGGQKSEQSDAGEQGSGVASDQGKKGANKAGPGDKSDEAGDTDHADQKTGQPGSKQKGKGSSTKPSDDGAGEKQDAAGDNPGDKGGGKKGKGAKGGKSGQGEEAGDDADGKASGEPSGKQSGKPGGKASGESGKDGGKDSGGQPGSGKPSQPGKAGGSPQKSGGGISSNPGPGNKNDAGESDGAKGDDAEERDRPPRTEPPTPEEEAANLENARKATNLVLKRLKSQLERGEVDQEMLDEMGWKGKQDVEKFVRYLEDNLKQNADDNSPEAEARRMQFEETLRNLDLGSETQRRSGSVGKERAIQQIGTKSARPPREYEKIWESYTRSLSKTGEKSEPKSKPADKTNADKTNTDKAKKATTK